jgi:uncharacterized membrane-anchored protein
VLLLLGAIAAVVVLSARWVGGHQDCITAFVAAQLDRPPLTRLQVRRPGWFIFFTPSGCDLRTMSVSTTTPPATRTRLMLNKVPEVTIWFWVIKILCTTVGESFADWINTQLGVGLYGTAAFFTVVLAVAWFFQFRTDRYRPSVYWPAVVVVSVAGTLYTDILTDVAGVALWLSTTVFAALLAVVFAVWWGRERTLSIHSITTPAREAFYWLAVLVTFALGTAAGDWTLELTGWSPGRSVLLPAALIAIVIIGWRVGAGPVLSFWLAYILTRPLGANMGDWFALPKDQGGLNVGTFGTSLVFLGAIAATVAYLARTKADVIEEGTRRPAASTTRRAPVGVVVAGYALVVVLGGLVLHNASNHRGSATLDESESGAPAAAVTSPSTTTAAGVAGSPGTGTRAATTFTAAELEPFRTITQDTLNKLNAGDQAGATARIKDLETSWDRAQSRLQPRNPAGWTDLDGKIDTALRALRAKTPNPAAEQTALTTLLGALG